MDTGHGSLLWQLQLLLTSVTTLYYLLGSARILWKLLQRKMVRRQRQTEAVEVPRDMPSA